MYYSDFTHYEKLYKGGVMDGSYLEDNPKIFLIFQKINMWLFDLFIFVFLNNDL